MNTRAERIPHANKEQGAGKEGVRKIPHMFDITETTEGTFEVVLPGFIDLDHNRLVGEHTKKFETREDAEAAVSSSKEDRRARFELHSLEKSFPNSLTRIYRTDSGLYRVTTPGFKDKQRGWLIGEAYTDFDSWDEAKERYLKNVEQETSLTELPILTLQVRESEQVSFSDFKNFNPKLAPSESPREVPSYVDSYIRRREERIERNPNYTSFQETIKRPGYRDEIFRFVQSFLEQDGHKLIETAGIKDLDALTPKQAAELSTNLVIELTKYNHGSEDDDEGGEQGDESEFKLTAADRKDVLTLLREGLENRDDETWEGNGVCRHFAVMVKTVFESLKSKQTKFSRLNDTYCVIEDGDEYKIRHEDTNKVNMGTNRVGHAWNSFITVSGNRATATIVDATWADKDLVTGEILNVDYTLTRMEPLVHETFKGLTENSPDRQDQQERILDYYLKMLESPSQSVSETPPRTDLNEEQKRHYTDLATKHFGDRVGIEKLDTAALVELGQKFENEISKILTKNGENQFFGQRAVNVMKEMESIPALPKTALNELQRAYESMSANIDRSDLEVLWRAKESNPDLSLAKILTTYTKNKMHPRELIFTQDGLQRAAFESIEGTKRQRLLGVPEVRVRMREASPESFLEFSPAENEADGSEFGYLAKTSQYLPFKAKNRLERRKATQEDMNTALSLAREELRKLNPKRYEQIAENIDDYALIKRFDELYLNLSSQ